MGFIVFLPLRGRKDSLKQPPPGMGQEATSFLLMESLLHLPAHDAGGRLRDLQLRVSHLGSGLS